MVSGEDWAGQRRHNDTEVSAPGVVGMKGRGAGEFGGLGRTRRRRAASGRLALRWLGALLLALAVLLLAPRVVRVVAGPVGAPPAERWEVQPGDTLWAIASARTAPGTDVRETLQRIKEFNGLRGSTIHPGQVLLIPRD